MNDDIGNIPAAELVEEWRRLRKTGKRNPLYWSNQHDKNLVASELDRRCETAGITFSGDRFWYGRLEPSAWDYAVCDISAAEQNALEGWLLMKGGNP